MILVHLIRARRPGFAPGGAASGQHRRTNGLLAALAALVLVVAPAGCSSSSDGGSANGAGTGTTPTDSSPVAPDGERLPMPSGSVTLAPPPPGLPQRIAPAPEPTGTDDLTRQSAANVTTCLGEGSCQSVEAPRLSWPGADLTQQDFSFAVLTGADFRQVRAVLATFTGASLSGANFSGANLSGANLSGADLQGANLALADLRGADLRGAQLQNAILDGATLDAARFCQTRMPDGSERNTECPPGRP